MCRASVVIPVYNVRNYLDECLASVVGQTMADFEAICVDDGSTDGSGELAEAWAARDARIRVLHKPNGGLSSARNAGVDVARGSYVFFLDSDDLLEPDALERVCRVFERTGSDVVTFGASCFPDEPSRWLARCLSPREVTYQVFDPALLLGEASTPFAWRTACAREWLVSCGVRFDEGVRYGEDSVWHFSLYPEARQTTLLSDKVYRYRLRRAGSLMSEDGKGSERRILQHVLVVERVFARWAERGLLERWGGELASWSVSYVLYAALRMGEGPAREEALTRLSALYVERLLPRMRCLAMHRSVRDMVLLATGHAPRRLVPVPLAWRIHEYGILDLVQTALGLGGSRSGSGE